MRLGLSLNGILAVAAGALSIAWGAWGLTFRISDINSYGFVLLGFGAILFGITDGFSDRTHRGQFLFKIGVLVFLAAALALGYSLLRQF
ncbi:MAG: hypothetical protein J5I65_11830 [Aridibacter famidurans]|nr:hypothetical protein [Aridibacter famidurans]